ncbi:MAG TPA: AAA family ATPase [Solirubrobacterales bacterium]|nr:AAA family ATPase [Solirubrobacterales bacterium]
MHIRRLTIERYRGIRHLELIPGLRTVILGPQNAGKSSVLEALDLLLHHGYGRRRPDPTEIDYFERDPTDGFEIEAVIGGLSKGFAAEVAPHLEGWNSRDEELFAETDGDGIEPVVRVRVRGNADLTVEHQFSKPESEGATFNSAKRIQLGWVFDGRTRDPLRQLAFYQGGLLERLFADANLDPAVLELREALQAGAGKVNSDDDVSEVLADLGGDLEELGLVGPGERPSFEAGSISQRELLQSLRIALPHGDVDIPLFRQGRGAQRLVLVTILLKIARSTSTDGIIGGFEEPEEALEPLRQSQMADMLFDLADDGGQIFVVTHSPEVARRFEVDDFVLMPERQSTSKPRVLRKELSDPDRHGYERLLDGAMVRGLFARAPVLVEGPGDRAVLECFWRHSVKMNTVRPAAEHGVDIINCEGNDNMPMLASVLTRAGKRVVAWTERDNDQVNKTYESLRTSGHCSLVASHCPTEGYQNLEGALARGAQLDGLIAGLSAIANDREYDWDAQRDDLVSRAEHLQSAQRDACKSAADLEALLKALSEDDARTLIAKALSAKNVTPFTIKGGRHARIFAETIVKVDGVPANFSFLLERIQKWIDEGSESGCEIEMPSG